MTVNAENFDVFNIISQFWVRDVLQDVVALKILLGATILALTYMLYFLANGHSNFVRTMANAALPVRMIFFSMFKAISNGAAFVATKFARSAATFSSLKVLATLFASVIYHYLPAFLFDYVRAGARTGMSLASHMSMRTKKFIAAILAYQLNLSSLGILFGVHEHGC